VTSNVIPLTRTGRRDTTRRRTPAPRDASDLVGDVTLPAGLRHTPAPAAHSSPTPAEPVAQLAVITRAVYTVAEVAELLSLSLGSTYAMVRAGQIPARKLGGRWVVPKRRFHAWLDDLPDATDDDLIRELGRIR
jgi:excisionase family DNA binding protein